MNALNNNINNLLILLFIIYLLGYIFYSTDLLALICISQIFLIENIVKDKNRLIHYGEVIIGIASLILFISNFLNEGKRHPIVYCAQYLI